MSMTDLVVRRRAGLMALIAATSALFGGAYGWVYARSGDTRALAVAAVMAVVALAHAWAWRRARSPMLVADGRGVRVRLGSRWAGLDWSDVERVEVSERGPVRDGRIAIVPRSLGTALAQAGGPARAAGWLNERMYGRPLVVPYGLTTSLSVVDPAASVERLSGGSTRVVRLDRVDDAPATSAVAVSPAPDRLAGRDEDGVDLGDLAGPDSPPSDTRRRRRLWPVASTGSAASTLAAGASTRSVVRAPVVPATATSSATGSRGLARREDVTIAGRASYGIVGDLALAPDGDAGQLPEIEQLRRRPDPVRTPRGDDNVSLIIDATTDLSARAMRKVRRAQASAAAHGNDEAQPETPEAPWETVIGDRVRGARLRAGLDVDELAERTRIRPYVIEAIEADDFGPCGGDFYARGHLRTLARVLGVDPDALLADYDASFASSPVSAREVFEVELATGGAGLVRGGDRSANWAAIVAAVLVLALVWGLARYFTESGSGPGRHDVVSPSQTVSGLGSPGPGNPPVVGPVIAHVKVSVADTDTRVVVRDRFKRTVFEGVIPAGESRKLDGEAPLRVMAADGGQVSLSAKGKSLGVMGEAGVRARERISAHPH